MSAAVSVPSAGSEPAVGARWHRVALQVNPFGYVGASAPSRRFVDEASYNSAMIAECRRIGIDLIAVTDHWHATTAAGLIAACDDAGIVALPGFEAESSEGIHVLVIFEHGTPLTTVEHASVDCGGAPGSDRPPNPKGFAELLSCATGRGALVVPAHVNGAKGLLTAFNGGSALALAWRNPGFQAVAVQDAEPVTEQQRQIIDNREPNFLREHPVAELHADDISEPTRLSTPGGSCWMKMAVPTLAGIRLAVRTPTTRVSLVDPRGTAHPALSAISWTGGFLDGVRIAFSDAMTCLVGGRGTGKSTVVESLRFGLGVQPIGDAAGRTNRRMVENVLDAGTVVTIEIETGTGGYTVERSAPDGLPVLRDAVGTVLASRPVDVLGGVEIFGQHELAELAESGDYVAEVLLRFNGNSPRRPSGVTSALRRNREEILAVMRELEQLDERLEELPRHRESLERLHASGLDERLAEQAAVDRERELLTATSGRVDDLVAATEPLRDTGLLDTAYLVTARQGALGDIVGRLRAAVSTAVVELDRAVAQARAELTAAEQAWSGDTARVREQLDSLLRELRDSGVDGNHYLAVRRAVETLSPLVPKRDQERSRLQALKAQRVALLDQLQDEARADRNRVAEACRTVGAGLDAMVIAKPVPSTDRRHVERLLDDIPGQRVQMKRAVSVLDFSPARLADAARRGPDALAAEFDINGQQAERLAGAGEGLLMELEEMVIATAASVLLNVAGDGKPEYRQLDDLSQGQKATALLLILLASSSGPLVVDQPEDDLDNRFIWERVVPRIRELKETRQLIFSTHNANIPVLGDAELVVVLESEHRRGRVAEDGAGSLDQETVRDRAEQILEGGREAFRRRRYLYGF